MNDEDIELPLYTGDMAEIVENFGQTVAIKILRAKGGRRAYIPSADKLQSEDGANNWLVHAVGMDTALEIAEHFEVHNSSYWHDQGGRVCALGITIDVPVLRDVSFRNRIKSLIEAGSHSVDEIAGMTGCSRRTVYRYKKQIAAGRMARKSKRP